MNMVGFIFHTAYLLLDVKLLSQGIDSFFFFFHSENIYSAPTMCQILFQLLGICDGGLFAKLCPTLVTPWAIACWVPLSMGFHRKGYWSGLPFPSPGNLPDPGIEPASLTLQADSLPLSHQGNPAQAISEIKTEKVSELKELTRDILI